MTLIERIKLQEQKSNMDKLRQSAEVRGIRTYTMKDGRLMVWCNGGFEEVRTAEELDKICA